MFDRYVSQERRNELLVDLEAVAEWTAINGVVQACRDPDDDKFLETALVAQADCIVTGDGDLLALDPFEHLRIMTAASFLEAVSADSVTGALSAIQIVILRKVCSRCLRSPATFAVHFSAMSSPIPPLALLEHFLTVWNREGFPDRY